MRRQQNVSSKNHKNAKGGNSEGKLGNDTKSLVIQQDSAKV